MNSITSKLARVKCVSYRLSHAGQPEFEGALLASDVHLSPVTSLAMVLISLVCSAYFSLRRYPKRLSNQDHSYGPDSIVPAC
jgi:hypothetical protein